MEEYFIETVEVIPCRICGSLEGAPSYILIDPLEDEGVLLHEALEFVTCLKVDIDDGMSQVLCTCCCKRLQDAFRFKNQALDSYKAFYDLKEQADISEDTPSEEDVIELHSTVNDDTASEEIETIQENAKTFEIDMNTDAANFVIEHYSKNVKNTKSEGPLKKTDWMSESIQQNPRAKYCKHECHICVRKFRKKSNLVDHLRLHANVKKFTCSYCDKSFVQIANYRTHLRIHTKERPFHCPLCEKSYNQSSTLKVHIRSHTQERNYKCLVCSRGFTNSSDLNKHAKVHDRSQQYKCEFCDKLFAQKVNMKTHQKRHHFMD